jgi:PTH1 family peptidyl-tRNA hydrolase
VILLKPLTFMNRSGEAVASLVHYFKIELPCLIVVVDDVAIPLGQLRMRTDSGSGGHNGLKSVEESLQTSSFVRLRIGVGDREEGDLASYVLGQFSQEEKTVLPEILERAVRAVELWLAKGLNHAMDYANANRPPNPRNGE